MHAALAMVSEDPHPGRWTKAGSTLVAARLPGTIQKQLDAHQASIRGRDRDRGDMLAGEADHRTLESRKRLCFLQRFLKKLSAIHPVKSTDGVQVLVWPLIDELVRRCVRLSTSRPHVRMRSSRD